LGSPPSAPYGRLDKEVVLIVGTLGLKFIEVIAIFAEKVLLSLPLFLLIIVLTDRFSLFKRPCFRIIRKIDRRRFATRITFARCRYYSMAPTVNFLAFRARSRVVVIGGSVALTFCKDVLNWLALLLLLPLLFLLFFDFTSFFVLREIVVGAVGIAGAVGIVVGTVGTVGINIVSVVMRGGLTVSFWLYSTVSLRLRTFGAF
jgi:hypothetical protein